VKSQAVTLRAALAKAKIDGYVRPFHDGRHTSLTNSAAAGMDGMAIMARAGHSDFATTQLYIDLAGERFRDESELLERRLFGPTSTKNRYQVAGKDDAELEESGYLQA
jgi:integrase